jgi:hypothetical protein
MNTSRILPVRRNSSLPPTSLESAPDDKNSLDSEETKEDNLLPSFPWCISGSPAERLDLLRSLRALSVMPFRSEFYDWKLADHDQAHKKRTLASGLGDHAIVHSIAEAEVHDEIYSNRRQCTELTVWETGGRPSTFLSTSSMVDETKHA